MTCTPRPGSPSPWTVHRYLHNEHRHIVVLLVTCEHTVNEVLEKPFGPTERVRIGTRSYRRQLLQACIEATIPVLHQTIRIKNRRAPGRKLNECCRRGLAQPSGVPAST